MTQVAYTVTATLPDEPTAAAYAAWLQGGHIAEVLHAGAISGQIVRINDPSTPIRIETRYIFSDRPALDRYIRDHAPRLRAEGLARFPPALGIAFERRIGSVLSP